MLSNSTIQSSLLSEQLKKPLKIKVFEPKVGSGYPGDPATKSWLKSNFDPVFGFPSLVRFSWKTSYSILESNDAKADWFDGVADPGSNA